MKTTFEGFEPVRFLNVGTEYGLGDPLIRVGLKLDKIFRRSGDKTRTKLFLLYVCSIFLIYWLLVHNRALDGPIRGHSKYSRDSMFR